MTQEAFKAWWYNEGSQAPYTHHDCEEHTMRMCEIAWANGAYKALAEHAMQEVQRLGQEIEPDDIASILACRDMLDAQPVPPRTEERNFCPRCGKRTADLATIHTCTPPQD